MKNTLLIILLLNFLIADDINSQWKAEYKRKTFTKTYYSIQSDNYNALKGYRFPADKREDSILFRGFDILKKQANQIKVAHEILSKNLFIKNFLPPLKTDSNLAVLYQRIYTENIGSYIIYFLSSDNIWYGKEFMVTANGYQDGKTDKLIEWQVIKNENDSSYNIMLQSISKIVISIKKINPTEKAKFIPGDFKIVNQEYIVYPYYNPFYDNLTKINSFGNLKYTSLNNHHNATLLIESPDQYIEWHNNHGQINIIPDSLLSKKEAIVLLYDYLIQRYPYYKERQVNKNILAKKIEHLKQKKDSLDYWAIIDSLNLIVNSFHDPHFKVTIQNKKENSNDTTSRIKKIACPLYFYSFYNKVYIAGVFDSILQNTIKPGFKVISIDYKPIDNILDSLRGENKARQFSDEPILNKTLYKQKGDSIIIEYISDVGKLNSISIKYNYKRYIPSNYVKPHYYFEELGDIAYLKLNHFGGDWIYFYNLYDKLKDKKSIIFDLRGNGGGSTSTVTKILSCFINKPSVLYHTEYIWKDNISVRESSVLMPNDFINLSHLKIAILIDKHTACAAEIFAYFLKINASCIIVGNDNSLGAFASRDDLIMNNEIIGYHNCMYKFYMCDYNVIENKGIHPDIFVQRNNVYDLAPFNDKVLSTALKYLQYKKTE